MRLFLYTLLSIEGHGITEILLTVRHPPAVKADETGIPCQFLDIPEPLLAGKETQMARMIPPANVLAHVSLRYYTTL